VFIRLMRDVVYHHLYKPEGIARWLESPDDPRREEYLARFADREGSVYLRKFFAKYHGMTTEQALSSLTQRVYANPARLTMLYRAIYPNHDETALADYLKAHVETPLWEGEKISTLFNKYSINHFDLQDQGYLTKLHPLELWLVNYLATHPSASQNEVLEAGQQARQLVYRWLTKSRKHHAQQQRIMVLLEMEAFWKIHEAWQRVGYPFEALTPSYATSIGASGDRPAALAELVGILLNNGVSLPSVRFESLHFAKDTPYETQLSKQLETGEQIFPAEVAHVAREALIGVVAGGTASRLQGVYKDAQGKLLEVGGKTGTGDHRKEIWGAGGRLLSAKSVSRAAVFTFFLGERFYGVMTAYVEGEQAGEYEFTSSLPVQIVKYLQPVISRLWLPTTEPSTAANGVTKPVPVTPPILPAKLTPRHSTQEVYQRLLNTIVKKTVASAPAEAIAKPKNTSRQAFEKTSERANSTPIILAPANSPQHKTKSESAVSDQINKTSEPLVTRAPVINASKTPVVVSTKKPELKPISSLRTTVKPAAQSAKITVGRSVVAKKVEPVIRLVPVAAKPYDNKPQVLPRHTLVTAVPTRSKVLTSKVEPVTNAPVSVSGQKKKPPTLTPNALANTLKPTRLSAQGEVKKTPKPVRE